MISVCIATYNGEKYIREQLESILAQLNVEDEVVICDDQSTDRTLAIIAGYKDARLRVFRNEIRFGHVGNFERVISLAKGDYIFLSDQDDVWIPGRVVTMMGALQSNGGMLLVGSNFDLIDGGGQRVGEFRRLGPVRRFRLQQLFAIFAGRMPYFGCTFLFKREAVQYFLPIPLGVESHDIWFALIASAVGRIVNLAEPTLLHRIHGGNVTTQRRRTLAVIFRSRIVFAKSLVSRMIFLSFKKLKRMDQ